MRPEREVAIVTGGGGASAARSRSGSGMTGASVGVLDTDQDGAMATAKALAERKVRAVGIAADVADSLAIQQAMERVARELGAPTILVNNAGFGGFVALGADERRGHVAARARCKLDRRVPVYPPSRAVPCGGRGTARSSTSLRPEP